MSQHQHLDRKELKRPDVFLSKAEGIIHWINTNSRTIMAGLGALFAIGLFAGLYTNYMTKKSERGASELYSARKALTQSLTGVNKTASDWEQKAAKSLEALGKIAKDYNGTEPALEALFLLGDSYLDHQNSGKAVEYFERAIKSASGKAMKTLARYSFAYALEQNKQYDKALEQFGEVASARDKILSGEGLLGAGRIYVLKGDKAKAQEQYSLAIKQYAGSAVAQTAEAQKQALGQ